MRTISGVVVALSLLLGACVAPSSAPTTTQAPDGPVAIVGDDEPGPGLLVVGRVVDAVTGAGIGGATVAVYQTDQTGAYAPEDPSDEATARIRGELVTSADGGFAFLTVQPGEYPDQPPGNRHIHFDRVGAPGYEPTGFVLLFDDNVRPDVRSWAEATGFGTIITLSGDAATGFEGFVEVRLTPAGG